MSDARTRDLTSTEASTPQACPAGVLRRLAALFYDLVLLFGVLIFAVAIVVIPYQLIAGAPFPQHAGLHRIGLQLYLVAIIGMFFSYFWVRDGQTLGMRTWHLRLVRDDGSALRACDALSRLTWATICLAPVGVGLLWMLFDRDHLTCYDRLSHTRPVLS